MIQRVQSIYLLVAFICSGVLPFFIPLWYNENNYPIFFQSKLSYSVLFGFSAVLSIFSILSFKKRKLQFVIGRLNIIFNLILLVLFMLYSPKLSGDTSVSEKGIGLFIPIISIVLIALANMAIMKDERLVKGADRIR